MSEVRPSTTPGAWHVRIRHAVPPTMRLAVFAGGQSSQLSAAFGCVDTDSAYWVTESGRFLTYVPVAPAVVNAEWGARFAVGILANTPMLLRCGTDAKPVTQPPRETFTTESAGRPPIASMTTDGTALIGYPLRMVASATNFAAVKFFPTDRYGPNEGRSARSLGVHSFGRDGRDPTLLYLYLRPDAPAESYSVRVALPDGRWADSTVTHGPAGG